MGQLSMAQEHTCSGPVIPLTAQWHLAGCAQSTAACRSCHVQPPDRCSSSKYQKHDGNNTRSCGAGDDGGGGGGAAAAAASSGGAAGTGFLHISHMTTCPGTDMLGCVWTWH